ncbi:MAG: putative NRPS-like protein biosynthetic cluster [Peltula sp. TS41687]|nr:MAG: putative NRPS-like protein biosynthetic cluster [Peltula sp. TS41687]
MATFNRYTDFPDLRSQINRLELEDHKQVQRSITVDTECLHHEDLILAWAALLHAYAGGEDIIFAVDGDTVKVNVLDETVTLIEADARSSDNNINGCRTAIYTKDDDDPSFPLCVCVAKDRVISIVVNTNMLSSELSTRLAKELAARIRWRRQYPGQVVRWHENDDLQLSMLNRKPQHMEGPCLLHHLFEGHALKEMYAVEYLGPDGGISRLSYKDVYRLSRDLSFELGKVLYEHNSTPYAALRIVPILIPQSPALYIAVLAVLMAGAAFCPLDPDAPQERIKFITGDLSAKVILTDEVFASRFCWTGCPEVMVLDPNLSLCHRRTSAQSLRIPESTSNDLAYVMYTSGSTGTPKGVGISHSAVTQSLLAHDEHIPHFRRFVQFAAPTFDVFVFELFFPFFRGSTLICCSRRDLLNDLPNIMNRMGVDAAVLTPTVVGGLIRKRDHVPDLKVLMTIGEMLTRPVIEEFGASDERAGVLYAMYGPTEASIHCTIAPTLHARSKAGMIGQPLVTVSAFIISPPSEVGASSKLEILPAGHVGELALGGYQLADGYFNRLEQTSQAFFELAGYGRIYRTGDKARLLPDGNLECLGRLVTDQVKVRGHRLELGEVEQVVSNLPNVRTAIATVVDGNLVVFCVPEDAHASVETVLEECRHWLPAPLVPEDVVLLDDVPRSPSGKADRKALEYKYRKNITQARGKGSSRRSVANGENSKKAWKPEERSIREVFSRLSAIEESHITQKTTIFQIGLDSVSAVHVAAGLRDQGWSVSAVDVLQSSSLDYFLKDPRRSAKRELYALTLRHLNIDIARQSYRIFGFPAQT